MKRVILLIIIFVGYSVTNVSGQKLTGSWKIVKLPPTTADSIDFDLYALAMYNTDTGIAVGKEGAIRTTIDGGISWTNSYINIAQTFHAVAYLNTNTIVCAGDSGYIFKSIDGSKTWYQLLSPTDVRLNGIAFANPDTGIVVGANGIILRTTDGGNQWDIITSNTVDTIRAVKYCGNNTFIVIGDSGIIQRTTDCGNSWIRYNNNIKSNLRQLSQVDSNVLFAAGDNWAMLKTTNAGLNWDSIHADSGGKHFSPLNYLKAFAWADTSIGWVCYEYVDSSMLGIPNTLEYRTVNGGQSWIYVQGYYDTGTITQKWVESIFFLTKTEAIAVGLGGAIAISIDTGYEWYATAGVFIPNFGFNGISFVNASIGYVFDRNNRRIQRTIDSGATWSVIYYDSTLYEPKMSHAFCDIAGISDQRCIVVGDSCDVLRTTDGGKSWKRIFLARGGEFNLTISMCDSINGIIGAFSVIYNTTNGGITWDTISLPQVAQGESILSVWCSNPMTFSAFVPSAPANKTFFIKTTNKGETWSVTGIPLNVINKVTFISLLTGWACGGSVEGDGTEIILHTIDGGINWETQWDTTMPSSGALTGISFADKNNGIAVGVDGSRILRTTNGGVSWLIQESGLDSINTPSIESVAYPTYDYAIAISNNNFLFYTGDKPLAVSETNRPIPIISEKIYPMPNIQSFINVEFSIPRRSNVNLIITDVLSRKMKTIMNCTMEPGLYNTMVDLKGFPNGKYFLILSNEGIVQSKSFLILK